MGTCRALVSGKSVRPCAPRLSSRAVAAVEQGRGDSHQEIGQLGVGAGAGGARRVRRRWRRSRPATAALRSTPAPEVMARCRRSRTLVASPSGRRPRSAGRSRSAPPSWSARPDRAAAGCHGIVVHEPRRTTLRALAQMTPGCAHRAGAGAWRRSGRGRPFPARWPRPPGAPNHALQQGVRGQAVGAVDAGAGHLAAGPQAGQGGGPVQVGDDAARQVVGGRARSAASRPGVEAGGPHGGGDGREALVEAPRGRWRRATGGRRPGRACGRSWPC